MTVSFTKTFSDLWQAQLSYTWSRLTGSYDGLYRPEDGQLDPNLNSTFDLKALLLNQGRKPLRGHHPQRQAVRGEGVADPPHLQR